MTLKTRLAMWYRYIHNGDIMLKTRLAM